MLKKVLKKVIKKIYMFFLRFLKIDNKKIVFDNFNGRGFGCNPKYIALELIKEDVDCKMIWLVNDIEEEMPIPIKKVKYGTPRAYYELATAKIWIDNVRNSKKVKKKKSQFYIQTWHASIGLKKCEADIEKLLSKQYVKEAKNDGKITDLMISDSNFVSNVFKNSFWYNGEIAQIGFPRNDILNDVSQNIIKKVYDYYKVDYSKKIVLYAPTFRKKIDYSYFEFDFNKICRTLEEKFNEEFVIFIRLHPNALKYSNKINENNKIINATFYPDIQEILAVSKIGITDYSSVAFDLAVIDKPVFLLCKDYDDFMKNERELFFYIDELPFSLALNEEELLDNIKKFSLRKYKEQCKEFFEREDIKPLRTSKASYNIAQIIKKKISID